MTGMLAETSRTNLREITVYRLSSRQEAEHILCRGCVELYLHSVIKLYGTLQKILIMTIMDNL
jgi:hypothetical protein